MSQKRHTPEDIIKKLRRARGVEVALRRECIQNPENARSRLLQAPEFCYEPKCRMDVVS